MKSLLQVLAAAAVLAAGITATPLAKRQPAPITPHAALAGPQVHIAPNNTGDYPRIAHLADNSYFAGWALHENGVAMLKTARSTDGGATWQQAGEVAREDDATHDLDNPFPFQLKSGRLLLAYRDHARAPYAAYTNFRLAVSFSDDGGASWSFLSNIEERAPAGVNGIWEPFLRLAADGTTLQVYYSSENSAADQDSHMRTSGDGGATWSAAATIGGAGVTARDGMLGVAPTDNAGGLIAVFETTECGGHFCVSAVYSPDDGATWGGRANVFTPAGAGSNAGAPSVQNIWGTLVVSFMTDESVPHDAQGYDGKQAKILTSADAGRTWGDKLTVANAAHWPGLAWEAPGRCALAVGVDGQGVVRQEIALSS